MGRDSLLAPDTSVLARKLSFSEVSADELPLSTLSAPERLRVLVRARPLAAGEAASDMLLSSDAVSIRTVKTGAAGRDSVEESSFSFDTVFNSKATQEQVFDSAMLPQVKSLFAGRDTLTFAYGVTNAGKTYTIQGRDSADEQGVLPRALEAIFAALAAHRARNGDTASGEDGEGGSQLSGAASQIELDDAMTYELRASFLEVYGNDTFDLLALPSDNAQSAINARLAPGAQPKRVPLRLKEDRGQVFVEGLKEVELPDLEAANDAVQLGWTQRAQASNGVNDDSSRSHAVLVIKLLSRPRSAADPSSTLPTVTRLCVVDLAGAERQKKTQADGKRLDEAKTINKDLMVLGHCLRDLRYNQTHPKGGQKVPPFRDSRITMLFRDYLSGNGQISVIAAVSPRASDSLGTLDTLRFAAIAQQVKVVQREQPCPRREAPLPACAVPGQRAAVAQADKEAGRPHFKTSNSSSHAVAKDGVSRKPSAGLAPNQNPSHQADGGAPEHASERSSAYSAADWGSSAAELEHENSTLREQVLALQQRLLDQGSERLALERSIREEVAAEMKEMMESREEEMRQRLEMERYNTEELYHKKLQLVKDTTEKRAGQASVAAHTEILQQTRDHQRRENDLAAALRAKDELVDEKSRLLDEARAHIEELKAAQAAAAASAEAAESAEGLRAELKESLAAAVEEGGRLREQLAESEEARAAASAQLETLDFQLQAERQAKTQLQATVAELQGRLSNVVELSRQSVADSHMSKSNRRQSTRGKAKQQPPQQQHAAMPEGGDAASPAKRGLAQAAEDAPADDAPASESPKRSRLSRRLRHAGSTILGGGERSSQNLGGGDGGEVEGKTSEGKPTKQSKLSKAMGGAVKAMMMGGSKKERAGENDASQVYLDVGGGSQPFNMPGETPIARRTRAGRAAN